MLTPVLLPVLMESSLRPNPGCRVINKGTVVEQGTHSQLLELGGIYSSLVRKQLQKSASSASFSSLAQVSSESSLRGFLASRSQQS